MSALSADGRNTENRSFLRAQHITEVGGESRRWNSSSQDGINFPQTPARTSSSTST
ncbi:hypothetical protein B0H10DRAFT_2026293 [Mycena sp. CBHHK59/15]|nr:hypothetical protein B0H10DRAFT_2026293 [Mycena sp. CBHHK59/15]